MLDLRVTVEPLLRKVAGHEIDTSAGDPAPARAVTQLIGSDQQATLRGVGVQRSGGPTLAIVARQR